MAFGDEGKEMGKVGIGWVLFAVLLVVVLAAVGIGTALSNKGMDEVSASAASLDDVKFEDYNQKQVRGTRVNSAIATLSKGNCAVLVATNLVEIEKETSTSAFSGTTAYTHLVELHDASGRQSYTTSTGTTVDLEAVNYHTQLATGTITYDNGVYVAAQGFAQDSNGAFTSFDEIGNLSKSGYAEYVPTSAKFDSYLLKYNEDIIGVVFVQTQE